MQIVCAWGNCLLGEKPPYKDKSVTHTMCHYHQLAELVRHELATKEEIKEYCEIYKKIGYGASCLTINSINKFAQRKRRA